MQPFHPDSKFMAAFTLFADVVIVNMLLVVTTFPIVTGGSALRAANAAIGEMVQGKGSRYGREFIRQLTVAWKAVTIFWLLLLASGGLLVYQQFVIFQAKIDGPALTGMMALALSGAFVVTGISVWFFALAARTGDDARQESVRHLFAESVLNLFRYLGRSVAAVGVVFAALWFSAVLPIAWSVPLTFFFLPGFVLYVVHLLLAAPLGRDLGATGVAWGCQRAPVDPRR